MGLHIANLSELDSFLLVIVVSAKCKELRHNRITTVTASLNQSAAERKGMEHPGRQQ